MFSKAVVTRIFQAEIERFRALAEQEIGKVTTQPHLLSISEAYLEQEFKRQNLSISKDGIKAFQAAFIKEANKFKAKSTRYIVDVIQKRGDMYPAILVASRPEASGTLDPQGVLQKIAERAKKSFYTSESLQKFSTTMDSDGGAVSRSAAMSKVFKNIASKAAASPAVLQTIESIPARVLANQSPAFAEALETVAKIDSIQGIFEIKGRGSNLSAETVITVFYKNPKRNQRKALKALTDRLTDDVLNSVVKDRMYADLRELTLQKIQDTLKVKKKKFKGKRYKAKVKVRGPSKSSLKRQQVTVQKPSIPGFSADSVLDVVSVKNLINESLFEEIKSRMGTGSATDVLNFRTGRFARSAEVRDIAAGPKQLNFKYSYMLYPYQTFEPGYKRGSPASRDPRLLIGKSIRAIAERVLGTQFRYITTRLESE